MMPVKWKIYRIMNFVLLISGTFIFLRLFGLSIGNRYQIFTLLTSLIFLFMTLQGLINLVIMTKNFPDKTLIGAKNRWHILAIILNGISLAGLTYACFSLLSEMTEYPEVRGLKILLLILTTLMFCVLFVFICQLTVKRYLQRSNTRLMNSMINSIGVDE